MPYMATDTGDACPVIVTLVILYHPTLLTFSEPRAMAESSLLVLVASICLCTNLLHHAQTNDKQGIVVLLFSFVYLFMCMDWINLLT